MIDTLKNGTKLKERFVNLILIASVYSDNLLAISPKS